MSDRGIQNKTTECVIWVARIEKVDISTLRSVFSHDRLIGSSKHIDERLGIVLLAGAEAPAKEEGFGVDCERLRVAASKPQKG